MGHQSDAESSLKTLADWDFGKETIECGSGFNRFEAAGHVVCGGHSHPLPKHGVVHEKLERVEDLIDRPAVYEKGFALIAQPFVQRTLPDMDLAASVQAAYEEAFFHLLRHVAERTGASALCLAGGCAQNSLANGRIFERTSFTRLYVPPAANDAGGAMGAAMSVWVDELGGTRRGALTTAALGPAADEVQIDRAVANVGELPKGVRRLRLEPREQLRWVADRIADGAVVGWFDGRMEFGPRALGQRSILADPRRDDVRDLLNVKIKHRERFRPFAPSVLAHAAEEWFETQADVPFMSLVARVKPERREKVPGITHLDGTARLQTVNPEDSPRYHALIAEFERMTGVPMLLNTSFNEQEPIVCTPEEALAVFLRTEMDVIVMEGTVLERASSRTPSEAPSKVFAPSI